MRGVQAEGETYGDDRANYRLQEASNSGDDGVDARANRGEYRSLDRYS
jgi:hypothetical protein